MFRYLDEHIPGLRVIANEFGYYPREDFGGFVTRRKEGAHSPHCCERDRNDGKTNRI